MRCVVISLLFGKGANLVLGNGGRLCHAALSLRSPRASSNEAAGRCLTPAIDVNKTQQRTAFELYSVTEGASCRSHRLFCQDGSVRPGKGDLECSAHCCLFLRKSWAMAQWGTLFLARQIHGNYTTPTREQLLLMGLFSAKLGFEALQERTLRRGSILRHSARDETSGGVEGVLNSWNKEYAVYRRLGRLRCWRQRSPT